MVRNGARPVSDFSATIPLILADSVVVSALPKFPEDQTSSQYTSVEFQWFSVATFGAPRHLLPYARCFPRLRRRCPPSLQMGVRVTIATSSKVSNLLTPQVGDIESRGSPPMVRHYYATDSRTGDSKYVREQDAPSTPWFVQIEKSSASYEAKLEIEVI